METSTGNLKNGSRVFYFDVLRTIACFSVILFHVIGNYISSIFSGADAYSNPSFWVANFFYSISRLGVPIFVMISGGLLLDERYIFSKEKLKKHILKISVFYIFWFVAYAVFFKIFLPIIHNEGNMISVKSVLSVADNDAYHLWFLPMIVGLYLITPLLKKWVNTQNKREVEYFLCLSIAYFVLIHSTLKILNFFADLSFVSNFFSRFGLEYVGGYVLYFVLGWYLHNFGIKRMKAVAFLGIIGFLTTYFASFLLSSASGKTISPQSLHNNFNPNILLMAVFVFLIAKKYCLDNPGKKQITKVFYSSCSKYSFGIYGVHEICIYFCAVVVVKSGIKNALFEVVATFIGTAILSYFVSFVFSKIPLLKKVV